jgi:hypothetical protein
VVYYIQNIWALAQYDLNVAKADTALILFVRKRRGYK